MKIKRRIRAGSLLLAMVLSVSTLQPAYAAVTYMPDVTAEMSDASFWAEYHDGYMFVIGIGFVINYVSNTVFAFFGWF